MNQESVDDEIIDEGTSDDIMKNIIKIRHRINTSLMSEYSPEIALAKKRVAKKILDMFEVNCNNNMQNFGSIDYDLDLIDEDIFISGTIHDNVLLIDIPPINLTINLVTIIRIAIIDKKTKVIQLMMKQNIDLFQIEPNIMSMCVASGLDDLLKEMIAIKIPIFSNQYRCVYQLASVGKLDLLKLIMKTYYFPNLPEIVYKICIEAVINNHVNIIEYFLPEEAFEGAPDQMYSFFLNSIEYGGHLPIIKYFIEGPQERQTSSYISKCINICQQNYQPIYHAIKFDRCEIIKYFCDIDPEVINLLTTEQKEKYNLFTFEVINQFIGTGIICNITYDEILPNHRYYECTPQRHHFSESIWKEWTKDKVEWKCPLCFTKVKKIIYVNANS